MEYEFDKLAESYEVNRLSVWYSALGNRLLDLLGEHREEAVLDLGCATGWLLRQMSEKRMLQMGLGIDLSNKMIEVARANSAARGLTNLRFLHSDWEQIDLHDLVPPTFDMAICANTLHYFSDPARAIQRVHACLKTGGRFFLLERNKTGSIFTSLWEFFHNRCLHHGIKFYSELELVRLLESAGFCQVTIAERIRHLLWKNKLYTSSVILCGTKSL